MSTKLIAIDIDGTLLRTDHQLSQANLHAIRETLANGVRVVLATGRSYNSSATFLKQFALDAPGLYLNGGTVCAADGTIIQSTVLPDDAIQRVYDFVAARNLPLVGFDHRTLYTPKLDWLSPHVEKFDEPRPIVKADWSTLKLNKLLLATDDPTKLSEIELPLISYLDGLASVVRMSRTLLAVMPLGIHKGSALANLCAEWKIAAEDVIAIGNAENDIEMLQFAGLGVAVANAAPAVKAAADVLVASNNEDGVAEALWRFVA